MFHNETLANMFVTAWAHVADRYKTWPMIAAYEIMSEPRDKSTTAKSVRDFYIKACTATQKVDPRTPCMVGSRPYYKLYTFTQDMILPGMKNIIYTFDYFNPEYYVFGM